jgi:hypothetical protein
MRKSAIPALRTGILCGVIFLVAAECRRDGGLAAFPS